ncbi:MAG: energy transducer TonB [Prevotellaceae bacterium]|nr:energy transducer TonB [Prevotellaceae bacterium]
MDIKKSYKADLEHRRLSAFLLGLVIVLSLCFVALEFTTHGESLDIDDKLIDDVAQDMEMMPAIQHKDMIAAPAPSTPKLTAKINVVENEVNEVVEDNTTEINNTDSDGIGSGNGTADDAEQEQTTAQSPLAVDMNDNPLNFQVVERLPEFPGGMVEFMKWLTKNLRYPVLAKQQKIEGKVIVSFIINKDGSITDRKVVKSVSPELDREALRVLRQMPKWKPGEDHGKPCRTYFSIPINFKL